MRLLVKDVLSLGRKRLSEAGIFESRNDSEELFCYLNGIDRNRLFMEWPKEVLDETFSRYFELLDIRCSGMPLQYITGHQEFMGLDIKVDENVLIPRQDTEVVVEKALDIIKNGKKIKNVLDLCTGSGAIAVSIAKLAKGVHVTASDISEKALETASENAKNNGEKINFVQGDLFGPFERRTGRKKFDLIISNPPYIESGTIETLDREVKEHEPRIALDGGEDGLDFYRKIIEEAPEYLSKHGILILETGCSQAESIKDIAHETDAYEGPEIFKDLAGLDRGAVLRKNPK